MAIRVQYFAKVLMMQDMPSFLNVVIGSEKWTQNVSGQQVIEFSTARQLIVPRFVCKRRDRRHSHYLRD
jgi:hypothetical protein